MCYTNTMREQEYFEYDGLCAWYGTYYEKSNYVRTYHAHKLTYGIMAKQEK